MHFQLDDFLSAARLSDLPRHYSAALDCSQAAAAWELSETLREIADLNSFGKNSPLSENLARVGSVSNPKKQRGGYSVTLAQLIDYFDSCITAGADCGFVSVIRDGHVLSIPSAAVCINLDELWSLLKRIERDPPYHLVAYNTPHGKSLGALRSYHDTLLEIASSSAKRSPDDPFCKLVASLVGATREKDLSRMLRNLAAQIGRDDFPCREALNRILSDLY